jgi:nucleotide-binding universal stress UspA family protein
MGPVIRTILVPVDFSETSKAALDYAVSLAHPLGARLIVMHAYELPVYGFPDGAFVASAEVATRLMSSAQSGLDAFVAPYRDGVRIDTVLRQGIPWEEVRAVAEDVGADLVVIGTHGRRGIARALLGSAAEKIVRTSQRPVLTVHLDGQKKRRARPTEATGASPDK